MRRSVPLLVAALAIVAACSDDDATEGADTSVLTATTASAPASTSGTDSSTTAPAEFVPDDGGEPMPAFVDLPEQPDGVPFPARNWPTGNLPTGVSRARLDEFVDLAFAEPGDPAHVRSIVVIHRGRLVYEAYHPSYDAETVNASYSVAKSVASAAIGMLVGDGLVAVDEPAPVAGWDDERRNITVADLLHMASGLEWRETYEPGSPPFEMLASSDASESAAGRPLVTEPGTVFNYSTGTTAILAQIITDAAWAHERDAIVDPDAEPDPEAGVRFLDERLFQPLGIRSVQLMRDPEGTWLGGLGANMTSRDFARFGLLYMRDGVWDGERLLPKGWVQYSFTPSDANPEYGAQWWLEPDDDRAEARGLFGQMIALVPDEDLVVVVNSQPGGNSDDLVDNVIDEFRNS